MGENNEVDSLIMYRDKDGESPASFLVSDSNPFLSLDCIPVFVFVFNIIETLQLVKAYD